MWQSYYTAYIVDLARSIIDLINCAYINILCKLKRKIGIVLDMDEQREEQRQQRQVLQQLQQQFVEDQRELGDLVQAVGHEIDAFLEEAQAFMQELEDIDDSDAIDEGAEEQEEVDEAEDDIDDVPMVDVELLDFEDSDIEMDMADEEVSNDEELEQSDMGNASNRLRVDTTKTNIYSCRPLQIQKCHYSSGLVPCARSGHRVIADEANLYSLGGYNPRSAMGRHRQDRCLLFQELWRYNFATCSWHLLLYGMTANDMPTELASNALIMHNNKLISHGGTGYPFGELCSNDCYVYTTGSKPSVSCLKVTGELPTAQYGPGIVIHDNYLYTIGGTTGFDYSCDVYRLNLKTRVWERVYISRPDMREDPEGRYRHEVVYDGQHIYVLGGGTSNSVYDLQRIPAFNLKENRWDYFETLPDRSINMGDNTSEQYPRPRKCFSCVQHKNTAGDVEAFITGGLQVVLDGEADMRSYFGDIWRLNMRTKQWTCIRQAVLPKPLYFHSAAHSGNGCMWIFGGIEYNAKDNHRRNYMFKMWMTVPSLSDMCWEAITYYNERLNAYDRNTLLSAGLPDRFVQRIAALKDKPRRNVLVPRKISTSV